MLPTWQNSNGVISDYWDRVLRMKMGADCCPLPLPFYFLKKAKYATERLSYQTAVIPSQEAEATSEMLDKYEESR